ncbi:MAG TPA: hypothetical protein VFS30_18445 [Dehalococcoidia bacterium]|nr:hypothetical protein [Dehalococcoidia bacterium]
MWTIVVAAALIGGLVEFCFGQLELPQRSQQPPEGLNQSGTSIAIREWSTTRVEFAANPDSPAEYIALSTVCGGTGTTFGGLGPHEQWDTVSFEFWEGSPAGWVEAIDQAAIVDCVTGERLAIPGEAYLLIHFSESQQRVDPIHDFFSNDLRGDVILEGRQICDVDGVVEWVLGLNRASLFRADSHRRTEEPFEYSVVSIDVLR